MGWRAWGQSRKYCKRLIYVYVPVRISYNLAIKIMLLHHDSVHSLRVTESQEAKTTRAACGAVPHYSALLDLSELRKIIPKRFCGKLDRIISCILC